MSLNIDNPRLPALLVSAAAGDDRLLASFADATVKGLAGGTVGLMARAVNCAADRPARRWREAEADASSAPFGMPIDNELLTDEFCRSVSTDPWPQEFTANFRTDVPALLITGTLDATNPVENARAVAARMSRAVLVDVENAAHEALPVAAVQDLVFDYFSGVNVAGRMPRADPPAFPSVDDALKPPRAPGR